MNPVPGRRFYLYFYASKGSFDAFGNEINGQLGWCLTQKDKRGIHHPISFNDQSLRNHEARLSN